MFGIIDFSCKVSIKCTRKQTLKFIFDDVCVCVCACARARVCVCVCVCVRAHVWVWVWNKYLNSETHSQNLFE